jgi:hypothetical protein
VEGAFNYCICESIRERIRMYWLMECEKWEREEGIECQCWIEGRLKLPTLIIAVQGRSVLFCPQLTCASNFLHYIPRPEDLHTRISRY